MIEVSDDKQRVRRIENKPIMKKSTDNIAQLVHRSVYVDGIPKHLEMSDLLHFFEQYSAKHIIIRKYFDKISKTYKSKGSAFVTFSEREQCDEFLKKTIVLNDSLLVTMHQETFNENKKVEKENKRAAKAIRKKC